MKSNINIINPFLFQNKKDRDSFPLKSMEKNIDKLFKIKSSKSNKFFLISKDDKTNSLSIIHLSSSLLTEKEKFSSSLPSLPSPYSTGPFGFPEGRFYGREKGGPKGPKGGSPIQGESVKGNLPSPFEREKESKKNEGPVSQNLPSLSLLTLPSLGGRREMKKRGKGKLNISSNKEIVSLLSLLETNSKFSNQLKGIQFKIAGRLRGAQRARSMLLNHGRISTQTFNSSLKFNKKQIYTK